MNPRALILIASASLAAAACSQEAPPVDKAREDAADVAQVQRMNQIPVIPITPQEVTFKDIEQNDLFGMGCTFTPPGGADPVFVGQEKKGWLKLEGQIVELTSDRSSEKMPYKSWTKYIGLENWLTLSRDGAAQTPSGSETTDAPGEIVIHDAADKVVYRKAGTVSCGA